MASLRLKMLGGVLLGLLAAITVVTMLSAPRRTPPPVAESRPAESPTPSAPPSPEPAAAPEALVSRSKGQSEWAFFFRVGDTLSRMTEGTPLGVVVRLERQHRFSDGSTGPAYVVRSSDERETIFDADELERRARIESIREIYGPPARPPDTTTKR
jgi:hypothetical protein